MWKINSIEASRSTMLACCLMLLHTLAIAWNACRHSPVIDETVYLPAGIYHWETGRFELASVSPPLVRLCAAIPVMLFADPLVDWSAASFEPGSRPEWIVGPRFVEINGSQIVWLTILGRWGCLPFAWIGGFACWRWGTEAYGKRAGLLALWLWCFCPNVLGAAMLLTPDAGGAATGVLAGYACWRWLRRPGAWNASVAGLGLGLALLTRTTWIVLVPLLIFEWIVCFYVDLRQRQQRPCRSVVGLVGVLALALYLLNLGYLFNGSFEPLGRYTFVSQALGGDEQHYPSNRFRATWLGKIPVPLPRDYLIGIDLQKRDFETKDWSFLSGEGRMGGWWYFYLYGLGVKLPLGLFGVLSVAAALLMRRQSPERWLIDATLLLPIGVVLLAVSAHTGFSHHVRYAYGILPFLFVWCSKVADRGVDQRKWVANFVAACLIEQAVSGLTTYPHSMSYFNELIGGPRSGYRHLVNSSIDWGQDLLFLRKWVERHPDAVPLHFAYFGRVNPGQIGISFEPIADGAPLLENSTRIDQLRPGWYALSVTLLQGRPFSEIQSQGQVRFVPERAFCCFKQLKPVERIGYSILIYHIEGPVN